MRRRANNHDSSGSGSGGSKESDKIETDVRTGVGQHRRALSDRCAGGALARCDDERAFCDDKAGTDNNVT